MNPQDVTLRAGKLATQAAWTLTNSIGKGEAAEQSARIAAEMAMRQSLQLLETLKVLREDAA